MVTEHGYTTRQRKCLELGQRWPIDRNADDRGNTSILHRLYPTPCGRRRDTRELHVPRIVDRVGRQQVDQPELPASLAVDSLDLNQFEPRRRKELRYAAYGEKTQVRRIEDSVVGVVPVFPDDEALQFR